MTNSDISLCMIIKDEAHILENCLTSVADIVAEIIIVDTGSQDNSKEIARKFGAKIIDTPWENDFAKARNIGLAYAAAPWILVLDADESIDHWTQDLLLPLLEAEHIHGYWLPITHYVGDIPKADFVTDHVCRLFRNDSRIIFRGMIHEETASSIRELPTGEMAYADLHIYHYGYLEDELQRKNKSDRNLSIINSALKLQPNQIALRYALGVEYYQQKQYYEAARILRPLLHELPNPSGYTSDLYLKTAFALQSSGQKEAAEEVFRTGISLFPDFTDLLESYAILLIDQGSLGKAKYLLEKALQSGYSAHNYPSTSGSGTYRTELIAGIVCERLFLYSDAWNHYEAAIQFKPDYTEAWKQLVPLALLSGDRLKLQALTSSHIHSFSPVTLSYLMSAALNAHDSVWQAELLKAPLLPSSVQRVVQLMLESNKQSDCTHTLVQLEEFLLEHSDPSERSSILGYLWALSCRAGDFESAIKWVLCMHPYRPGILSVHQILTGQSSGVKAALADISYAIQLLLQSGAWESVITLYEQSEAASFRWSSLPQPLFHCLLEAPLSIKKQWCAIYVKQNSIWNTPADCTEWLLYAAITRSYDAIPLLPLEGEVALRNLGGIAAVVALSYYKLLLAAEAYPHGISTGQLPWGLLVRSASQL